MSNNITTPPISTVPYSKITTFFIEELQAKHVTEKDTYVKFTIDGKKYRTKIHKRTQNPIWNEKFTITTSNKIDDISFTLVTQNILGNNITIGTAKFPLASSKLVSPSPQPSHVNNSSNSNSSNNNQNGTESNGTNSIALGTSSSAIGTNPTISETSSHQSDIETWVIDYWKPLEKEKSTLPPINSQSAVSTGGGSSSNTTVNSPTPEFKVKIICKIRDLFLDQDSNSATSSLEESGGLVPPPREHKVEPVSTKEMSILGKGGSQILKLKKKITNKIENKNNEKIRKEQQQQQQKQVEEQLAKERQKEIERENIEKEKERAREKLRQREEEEHQKQIEKERQEERRKAKEDKKKKDKEKKYIPDRPIDYFFVVGCSQKLEPIDQRYDFSSKYIDPVERVYKGELMDFYPQKENNDILPKHIWMYCFPKGIQIQTEELAPSFFPFVLTNETGARFYASCLTFYEPITDELLQELKKKQLEDQSLHSNISSSSTSVVNSEINTNSDIVPSPSQSQTISTQSNGPLNGNNTTTTTTTTGTSTSTSPPPTTNITSTTSTSNSNTNSNSNSIISASKLNNLNSTNSTVTTEKKDYFVPKCICVLSHYPFFSAFRISLNEIYQKVFFSSTPLPIERYIHHLVQELPLPQPSMNTITYTLGGQNLIALKRPSECMLPMSDLPFSILFKCLDIKNLLALVKSVILEEKVIIISSQYSLLTCITEILYSLIYPLQYPHVYVPILPELLLEYIYSPFPFIMGVHRSYAQNILSEESLLSEIVLVDLDNNTVHLPPTQSKDVQLPEKEVQQLINQLRKVVHYEILSSDLPNFNINTCAPINASFDHSKRLNHNHHQHYNNPIEKVNNIDDHIKLSFLQFFCNLFEDYRKFYRYVRVFPQPIAIFNKEEFIKSRAPASKGFYTMFLDTQAFAYFLEQHNWPTRNLFDYLIESKKYHKPLEELIQLYHSSIPSALGIPDSSKLPVIPVTPPSSTKFISTSIREYSRFPSLKSDLFLSNPSSTGQTRPLNSTNSSSTNSTPIQGSPTLSTSTALDFFIHDSNASSSSNTAGGHPLLHYKFSLNFEDQHKSFVTLVEQFIKKILEDQLPEQSDIQQIVELLKFDYGRQIFGKLLLHPVKSSKSTQSPDEQDHTKGRISDAIFQCLGDVLKSALREANLQSDFVSCQMYLEASFIYNRLVKGSNEFVSEKLRNLDIWQNYKFWERFFFDNLENKMKEIYGQNITKEMIRWQGYSGEKQDKILVEERDLCFSLLSNLVYNMINLGSQADLVRRFVNKMCSSINFDSERTDTMMQVVSNISRAREMIDMDEDMDTENGESSSSANQTKHQDSGGKRSNESSFLPIGLSSANLHHNEGRELMNNLIDEKSNVVAMRSFSRIMNLKTTWNENRSKKRDKTAFREFSENRGDYVVKTFSGHQEGILCAAVSQKENGTLITGSADSTLKVWDITSTRCVGTLEDHGGWVTTCEMINSDNSKLISGSYDKTLKLWDLHKCMKIKSLRDHKGSISCLINGPENHVVISGSYDNTINIWDTRSTKPSMRLIGHQQPIMCLTVVDGYKVLSGSRDTNIRLWDMRTSSTMNILSGHSDWVKCLESDSDVIISGSSDGRVKVWSHATGECIKTLQSHSGSINSLLIHSKVENDGSQAPKKFVTASSDSTLKVWDSNYAESYHSLEGHTDEIMNVSKFINNLIVSGSFDGTVKLWDPDSGKNYKTLHNHSNRISSLKTFDSTIVTTSWDKTAKVCQFSLDFRVGSV
ncbi:WD40 repeat-containing protein [Tieghemostelium lacteum]|uniref:WD40 repeat-containing protein n=1 Tax=Tieghemostelium lacteum TaxID=361077 RepID=A0A151Z4L2_TIELA|nr:WD40 repeat-containing protein [Tieghemostelium lacteum]|eukprot:KYQ88881.1 WD40 repeat-containing protein [Tieghemostelium lacteum]